MTDLDAYLRRIGYTGPRAPTVAVLHAVHRHHALAIPFENLGALRGAKVDYTLPALLAKLEADKAMDKDAEAELNAAITSFKKSFA